MFFSKISTWLLQAQSQKNGENMGREGDEKSHQVIF